MCDVSGKSEPQVPRVFLTHKYVIGGDYARMLWAFGVREVEVGTKSNAPCRWEAVGVEGVLAPVITRDPDAKGIEPRVRVWLREHAALPKGDPK